MKKYILSASSKDEDRKKIIEDIQAENNKISKSSSFKFMSKDAYVAWLLSIISSIAIGFFLLVHNEDYIASLSAAKDLKDIFALELINNEIHRPVNAMVVIFIVLNAISAAYKYFEKRELIKHNKREIKELNYEFIPSRSSTFKTEEDLKIPSEAIKILASMWTLACLVFISTLSGLSNPFIVEEVKLSGEISSIHYNEATFNEYTIFYEEDGYMKKIMIPGSINPVIKVTDEGTVPTFDIQYRTHGKATSIFSERMRIVSEENRSIEYYANITIPRNHQIQGTLQPHKLK